ncbi:MAG: serine hydrolase domain-containing protein [Candidatus Acetothermia bacterium]
MSRQSKDLLDRAIEEEIQKHNTFPGAELLITDSDSTLKHASYGLAQEKPSRRAMHKDTIFDLASLTKVIVTASSAMKLVEEGSWHLRDRVSRHLPRLEDREFTVEHLLTHTAGLPPWVDLFSGSSNPGEARDRLYTEDWPISTSILPPGERVIYSDIGFILLGQGIEAVSNQSLADFARNHIFEPLEMNSSCFCPTEKTNQPFAATEEIESRGGVLTGTVHDENAHALGGVAGHAGLFSTASDLGKYARMLLRSGRGAGKSKVLSARAVEKMTSLQTKDKGSARGLGWKLQGDSSPSAGGLLSDESFGHTGFTGGSLWLDPRQDLGIVFLTNRVHPSRTRGTGRIQRIRAKVHNCTSATFGS